jgi:hypothetical protein
VALGDLIGRVGGAIVDDDHFGLGVVDVRDDPLRVNALERPIEPLEVTLDPPSSDPARDRTRDLVTERIAEEGRVASDGCRARFAADPCTPGLPVGPECPLGHAPDIQLFRAYEQELAAHARPAPRGRQRISTSAGGGIDPNAFADIWFAAVVERLGDAALAPLSNGVWLLVQVAGLCVFDTSERLQRAEAVALARAS